MQANARKQAYTQRAHPYAPHTAGMPMQSGGGRAFYTGTEGLVLAGEPNLLEIEAHGLRVVFEARQHHAAHLVRACDRFGELHSDCV